MNSYISQHFNKDNLHHAYLIEGERESATEAVVEFIKSLGIETSQNSDFCHISVSTFKIDDARNLKSLAKEKGLTFSKKIFLISADSFLLEAQNSLLKIFEEPIENTHFFVITPDANSLLKTLFSRFYFIPNRVEMAGGIKEAEKFIKMPVRNRIDFIRELLAEPEVEDEDNKIPNLNSTRAKALKFLNALETVLHSRFKEDFTGLSISFRQILKVREFLRMPGSSTKTLMESIALILPNI